MRFLTLYTPAAAPSGPPDAAHMAKMGELMDRMTKAGVLVSTGGLLPRAVGGLRVRRANGKLTVAEGVDSLLTAASGYAILNVRSKDELVKVVDEFLQIAGDGESEIIQLMDGPPPQA
jgi:hypothetical protein